MLSVIVNSGIRKGDALSRHPIWSLKCLLGKKLVPCFFESMLVRGDQLCDTLMPTSKDISVLRMPLSPQRCILLASGCLLALVRTTSLSPEANTSEILYSRLQLQDEIVTILRLGQARLVVRSELATASM